MKYYDPEKGINLENVKSIENCIKGIKNLVDTEENYIKKKQQEDYFKSDEFRQKVIEEKAKQEKMNDPKEILKRKIKLKKQQRTKKLSEKQIKNLKNPKNKKSIRKPPTL